MIDYKKWIIKFNNKVEDVKFTNRKDLFNLFNKGPVTPDHVIRIKSEPLIIPNKHLTSSKMISNHIDTYIKKYKKDDSRFSINRKLLKNRSFDYFYKVIRLSYV